MKELILSPQVYPSGEISLLSLHVYVFKYNTRSIILYCLFINCLEYESKIVKVGSVKLWLFQKR
ncbi:hypothetical protein BpHYR1_002037 [Brachionus plicatilis]|uniref:Uncharacterized protein n=1 Tax=Brachionus plicatilis TaxID=10195 RepID=A0A3M7PXV5_BRAPC|nr:hypothetical protein BpHYR1_002037 [Brachionus plicatilis]